MVRGRLRALAVTILFAAGCGSDDASDPDGAAGSSGSAGSGGTTSSGFPIARPSNPGWPADAPLLDAVDRLCTFLLIGPSDAAGYYATLRNGLGGQGFARLLFGGGAEQTAFAGRDVKSLFPEAVLVDQAESGFTTTEMLTKLQGRIAALDPGASGCDTWVHIGNPGNDFNDNPVTIINADETNAAAAKARQNYAAMIALLRPKFESPADGRTLVLSISTIQDPTDATGKIPVEFQENFCGLIHNPAFTDELRTQAIANLATFNAEIAAEAAAQGAGVLDQHGAIFGHGMNAADRWLYEDCTHPNDRGHDAIRHYGWYLLRGEWLGE